MKQKAFLNEEEIRNLQKEEAASDKLQKKTPEQLEAIYRSGKNILVSASAGSGKTFVMAERILDQLMRGVAISQLFISTFTVKAATELKERLEKKISEQVQSSQDLDVKQHLVQQLADLPNAAIGTMDSFTQKFLMQHGYLLDIRPNFRILQNQTEQTVLKNEAFQAIFDAYYQSKEQEAFKDLVKNFADRSKDGSGFRKQVYTVYTFLQSTSSPKTWLEDSFLKGFAEADFAKEKTEHAQKIKDALWELEAFLSHHMRVEAQEFPKASYLDAVQFVLDEIASLTDLSLDEDFFSVLRRVLEIAKEKNGRALANASRKAELKPLADAYNEERKEKVARLLALSEELTFLDYQERYHQEMWEMGKTFQRFMRDFLQAYDKRKREENSFEFADISHYAIQILEDYPNVRTRYQERFHEIMVDEYQDTNHIQERMLELLSTGQNRFMVGDIKQSIYRFRQADPQIFNEKFQRYAKNPKEGELILLKENFRSSQEVLDATNYVFSHLMDQEVGEISYNQMHELVFANQKLEADSDNRARFLIYNPDKEEKEEASNLTGEMKMLVKELLYLHQQKGVSFGEMALLTATRSRNAQVLLALSEYGIPVQADGGEQNYLQSLEVQVMLDTLRTIHNPLQDYALIALMKSPMFAFEEDELARLSLQKQKDKPKENFYEKLQNSLENTGEESHLITETLREKLKQFLEVLDGWRFYARSHSLYDLIWKIYQERFYYDYVGALPNGEARQTNLYALALRADQFEKSSFKGLSRFISMINQVLESQHDLASVATTPPKDAVQLMTIHKSKGLEFPYVFLLNADQAFSQQEKQESVILSRDKGLGFEYVAQLAVETKDTRSPTQIKLSIPSLTYQQNKVALQFASYSEQMRLLYVAMTRAEKKLYLVGKASEEKLQAMEFPKAEKGVLSATIRLASKQFQDWIWAILHVFPQEKAVLDYQFVGEDQLTSDEIGSLERRTLLSDSKQAHNRQSETIKQALKMLKEVEVFNQKHAAGIALPSVQTPSQVKKLYEPVMEMDGVFLTQASEKSQLPSFELPEFGASSTVTGAMVGSAVHELMQRIDLAEKPTLASLEQALQQVHAPQAVKDRVDLAKMLTFFDTELGREMLEHRDKLYREQPFAFLKQDAKSKEHSVIRGILDGYLLYPDKIVLFDYKTDAYKQAGQLVHRYREQLALYAEALRAAYQIEKIEQYLILLGKDQVEVVFVNEQ